MGLLTRAVHAYVQEHPQSTRAQVQAGLKEFCAQAKFSTTSIPTQLSLMRRTNFLSLENVDGRPCYSVTKAFDEQEFKKICSSLERKSSPVNLYQKRKNKVRGLLRILLADLGPSVVLDVMQESLVAYCESSLQWRNDPALAAQGKVAIANATDELRTAVKPALRVIHVQTEEMAALQVA